MTEKQAEDLVRKNLEDYLKRMGHLPDNAGRYHCIAADHKDGNRSMTITNQGTLAKCWGHPGPLDTYNIFDAIGLFEHIRTLHAQKRRAFEIYHIKIDEISKEKPDQKKKKPGDDQQDESIFLPSNKDTRITPVRQKPQPVNIPVAAAPSQQEPVKPVAQTPALVSVEPAEIPVLVSVEPAEIPALVSVEPAEIPVLVSVEPAEMPVLLTEKRALPNPAAASPKSAVMPAPEAEKPALSPSADDAPERAETIIKQLPDQTQSDKSEPAIVLQEILIEATTAADNIHEWEEKLLRSYNLDLNDQSQTPVKPAETAPNPAFEDDMNKASSISAVVAAPTGFIPEKPAEAIPAEDTPAAAAAEPQDSPAGDTPAAVAAEPQDSPAEDTPAAAAAEPQDSPAEDTPAAVAAEPQASPAGDTPAAAAAEPQDSSAEDTAAGDTPVIIGETTGSITIQIETAVDEQRRYPVEAAADDQPIAKKHEAIEQKPESANLPESLAAYQESHNPALYLMHYMANAIAMKSQSVFSTGFSQLDLHLDGGLHPGLYVLCSRPAEGKTTFMLQMIDHITAHGQDVLLISLDQSRLEIAAKSLSRITLIRDGSAGKKDAKTARDIMDRSRYPAFSPEERILINEAMLEYNRSAQYLHHYEWNTEICIQDIKTMLDRHISITGNSPVVVIDSLQSLNPAEPGQSEKANTDQDIRALMRISRVCQIPILALSRVIRDDYVCDVILSMNMEPFAGTLAAPHRNEMEILKNRHGSTGDKITFNYYAAYNYFEAENEPGLFG